MNTMVVDVLAWPPTPFSPALAAAEQAQQDERNAARRRIIDAARGNQPRPAWDEPTRNVPIAPLLTRGQLARSRQAGRW
jgi:hypothetical protein